MASSATPDAANGEPSAAVAVRSCRSCTGLFLLALVAALYFAAPLLLPIVLAVLLNLLLSPAVRALRRVGVPMPLGAALVLLAVLAVLGAAIWQLAAPASDWFERSPAVMRQLQKKMLPLRKSVEQVQKAAEEVEKAADVDGASDGVREVKVRGPSLIERLLANAQSVVFGAVVMLVLVYFLMASDDFFLRKIVRVVPTLRTKIRAVEIGRAIEIEIGRYFGAFAVLNAVYGTLIAGVMYLLDMPNAALWGAMVGVLNFVPYLGPLISLSVIGVVSLITFDTLQQALLPPLVFLVIDAIEGNAIEPMLFGRSLSLNPVAIFVALLFWGWLWGAAGILLAVPILIVTKITCQHIEALQPIAEFLDRN
jgi:predicted PurR-regulated permease PerM